MNLIFKNIKYIKAFTILEAIVTMVVSSIAMGLIIGIYINNQRSLHNYLSISQNYQEGMYFLSILKTDLEKADYVYDNRDIIEIENGKLNINYFLNENNIIRENEYLEKDTFNVKVIDYQYSYLDSKIELVSNIHLSLQIDVFTKEIHISKNYSNATLFRLNHGR